MKWNSAGALALIVPVQAGLRFQCSTLTIQRLDPVVQPGSSPSSHVHHIVGGNAFNASMTGDVATRATCTTCEMAEDFSNYWTAALYVSSVPLVRATSRLSTRSPFQTMNMSKEVPMGPRSLYIPPAMTVTDTRAAVQASERFLPPCASHSREPR